ncbi:PilZ domain-containing protein [uncultured Sphingomonas sp.]|uniref:PilZ domain-containing protein n=1 Tax=uncultured Sphingomonas sp. TaxID=158754 RepID=UPI002626BC73|nr:PilZ domain-containing protein [uncultured Sphingomonas sp.]
MGADRSLNPGERSEHRDALRTLLVARLVRAEGHETLCRIRNLSPSGMMIETPAPVRNGEDIVIELRDERFAGRVMWTSEGQAGVHFAAPIDVASVLGDARLAIARQDRPRAPRFRVECPAQVSLYGRTIEATVDDLSQSGVRLRMENPLAPGSEFVLTIAGLPTMACSARWSDEDFCGAIFHGILPYDSLAAWLEG